MNTPPPPPEHLPPEDFIDKVGRIFIAAVKKSGAERAAYIAETCAGDDVLRAEVEELLRADDALPDFQKGVGEQVVQEEVLEQIGPYKLREKIGEGGFGTVWVADQERPVKRRVALKVIKPGMDTKAVIARFEQERQALAMMDHPNIAKVLEAGVTPSGRPFFVMELIRGVEITKYCDNEQLSTAERIDLFIKVCQAVQHAHQKGIVHRDLKPSNILVTVNDGLAEPKIIDFGVAKATHGRLTDQTVYTQFQQMIGTPLYMSPEQAELTSLDIDTRSDIYSLGVLLYELLTGHTPIEHGTLARAGLNEVRRIICEVEPPRPSMRVKTFNDQELTTAAKRRSMDAAKLPGTLRDDLDWIVMKCLEKDRKRRYDSASGLALDLQRHLGNEPVIACPPTKGYLLGKLIRRNKLVFAAGIAVFTALVGGVTIASWQAIRAQRAITAAEAAKKDALEQADIARNANRTAQQEAEGRKILLLEASNLRNQAGLSRLIDAKAGDGRTPEGLAYLSSALAYNSANTAAQATALFTLTRQGSAIGPRWPSCTLPSAVPICLSDDGLTLATVEISEAKKTIPAKSTLYLTALREGLMKRKFAEVTGQVTRLNFRPGHAIIAMETDSKSVLMWSIERAAPTSDKIEPPHGISEFEFCPNGRWCVTGYGDTAQIWDAQTGMPVSPILKHGKQVTTIRFSNDGRWLLTGALLENAARIWQVPTGEQVGQPILLRGHMDSVEFSPDSQTVVSAERRGAIQFWNIETRQPSASKIQHNMFVSPLKFRKDGRWMVSVCRDSTALLVNIGNLDLPPTKLQHDGEVKDADFSPDGQWVATGSQDGTVRIWEAGTGKQICEPLPHPAGVQEVRFTPSGNWIVTRGNDNILRVWSCVTPAANGRLVSAGIDRNLLKTLTETSEGATLPPPMISGIERMIARDASSGLATSPLMIDGSIKVSPDRKTLVAANGSRTPPSGSGRIWRVADWKMLGVAVCPETVWPLRSVFSSDSSRFVVLGYDNRMKSDTIRVFATDTGRLLPQEIAMSPSLHTIELSRDGSILAALNTMSDLHLYRMSGLEPILKKPIKANGRYGTFNTIVFSPAGQHVLTSSDYAHTADIWDTETGNPVGNPMKHSDKVNTATYSFDGKLIVTASDDRTVRIWAADTQNPVGLPLRHAAAVASARISRDGRWILSTTKTGYGTQGKEFLWEAHTGRLVSNLQTSGRSEFGEVPDWLGAYDGKSCRAIELPNTAETAPAELLALLELRAGLEVDSQGGFEVISAEAADARFAALRQKLESGNIPSPTSRFIRWEIENPRTRKVSPRDAVSVPELVETFVNSYVQEASKSGAAALNEMYLADPLHPLVHLAMANAESHPETARLWRIYGVKRRLLAPENETLYGKETLARYCRTSVRLLMQGAESGDVERAELARTALDLGKRLEPSSPAIAELEQLFTAPQK